MKIEWRNDGRRGVFSANVGDEMFLLHRKEYRNTGDEWVLWAVCGVSIAIYADNATEAKRVVEDVIYEQVECWNKIAMALLLNQKGE